jgi:hypothetical protein
VNLLPSRRVVSWTLTSSQPSLPKLLRSFCTSSITGFRAPSVCSERIRVFMGMTMYSHCFILGHLFVYTLEFAGVFAFVDVF